MGAVAMSSVTAGLMEGLCSVALFWVDEFHLGLVRAPPVPELPPAATLECSKCRQRVPEGAYSKTQRNKSGAKRKCKACNAPKPSSACVYCGCTGPMTKEHLLPKSAGGQLTVPACWACNHARGNRGNDTRFVALIRTHPALWRKAKLSSKDRRKTNAWLREYGLDQV